MARKEIVERIERLKRRKNAIIFAHNYARPEVVDIADVVGGSSTLIMAARETSADMIIVGGVDFMAETVAILNPDKKVILPDRSAICPMAQQLLKRDLRKAKRENPDAEILLYMNTYAETKALADCICTSDNAVHISENMDGGSPLLFGPDRGLVYYVSKRTTKRIIPVPEYGFCPVHCQIALEDILTAKEAHPGVKVVGHPECTPAVQDQMDYIGSTSEIVKYCRDSEDTEFLVAAEVGLLHMLKKVAKEKTFHIISNTTVCPMLKIPTLMKIEEALDREKYRITVPKEIAAKARAPIERMLELAPRAI